MSQRTRYHFPANDPIREQTRNFRRQMLEFDILVKALMAREHAPPTQETETFALPCHENGHRDASAPQTPNQAMLLSNDALLQVESFVRGHTGLDMRERKDLLAVIDKQYERRGEMAWKTYINNSRGWVNVGDDDNEMTSEDGPQTPNPAVISALWQVQTFVRGQTGLNFRERIDLQAVITKLFERREEMAWKTYINSRAWVNVGDDDDEVASDNGLNADHDVSPDEGTNADDHKSTDDEGSAIVHSIEIIDQTE